MKKLSPLFFILYTSVHFSTSLAEAQRPGFDNDDRSNYTSRAVVPALPQGPASSAAVAPKNLRVEVVDEPLLNLFRVIAKTHKINLVPQTDLKDQKITIHLQDIPLEEGLRVICRANGLDLVREGDVYFVRKATDETISNIRPGLKRIDIVVENQDVKNFIRDFSYKTGISIAPGQDLKGKVTGHFRDVNPIDGFKALMIANGLEVKRKGSIYIVESNANTDNSNQGYPGQSYSHRRSGGMGGSLDIDVNNGRVSLKLKNAQLNEVIPALIDQAGLNMVSYGNLDGSLDADLTDVPLEKALGILLQGTRFSFVVRDGMILIGDKSPGAPASTVLSTSELVNLKYLRVDKLMAMLPKNISGDGIKEIKEQNAVLITGTSEYITQVKEFLVQIDLPIPQVLLEVIIVEFNHKKSSELGIKNIQRTADKDPTAGIPRGLFELKLGVNNAKLNNTFDYKAFSGSIGVMDNDFFLNLTANLSQDEGKVLAMPKITTLNGNKATLQVANTKYFPVSTFNQEGSQSTDYRSIPDGITIDITPWVTHSGDVNLQIAPSIKSASPDQPGENGSVRPGDVRDRNISTNVRLMDGETLVLGGLIDTKNDVGRVYVPILGHIPILGYLFSYRTKSTQTSELTIFVTPRILHDEDRNTLPSKVLEEMGKRGKTSNPLKILKDQESKNTSSNNSSTKSVLITNTQAQKNTPKENTSSKSNSLPVTTDTSSAEKIIPPIPGQVSVPSSITPSTPPPALPSQVPTYNEPGPAIPDYNGIPSSQHAPMRSRRSPVPNEPLPPQAPASQPGPANNNPPNLP